MALREAEAVARECARVFEVTIRRREVPGSSQAVYSFEEPGSGT